VSEERSEEIRKLEALCAGAAGALAFPALAEAHRRAGRPEAAERVARQGLERAPGSVAGRVALGLALLDRKHVDEARAELARVLGMEPAAAPAEEASSSGRAPAPGPVEALVFGEVGESELDAAFAEAEADRGQVVDADDVARRVLDAVPDDEAGDAAQAFAARDDEASVLAVELADDDEAGDAFVKDVARDPASPFATETVAGLLERQGHGSEAERIRAALASGAPAAAEAAPDTRMDGRTDGRTDGRMDGRTDRRRATLERWLGNLRRETR